MFQYGRYLLISSSRAGGLPANLQGKWNMSNQPPWRCHYHTDINIQMNYWLVDVANLIRVLRAHVELDPFDPAKSVPRQLGKAFKKRGWLMRGESGLFGRLQLGTGLLVPVPGCFQNSSPITTASPVIRTTCAQRAYPAMKEVWEFGIDSLEGSTRRHACHALQAFPPNKGRRSRESRFDQQLVWDLLTSTIEAS